MIIIGLDALDLCMVEKFNCENLMQLECGQTEISDFPLKRTVALWSSFLAGKNLDAQIPLKTQWEFRLSSNDTFLKFFSKHLAIDVPGYSHKPSHAEERELLKGYFEQGTSVEEFDAFVWKLHEENKKEFFASFGKYELLMGYFNLADSIGHLSFGMPEKMKSVYKELEGLAKEVRNSSEDFILIISDHGMTALGRFGDHSDNGFFSVNKKLGLVLPRITDFYDLIRRTQSVT
jgi:hypothetical protein